MNSIKMIAKLGDQQFPVGNCNSAQARILVRDGVAVWQDGSLLLFVRQAHVALLEFNPNALRGPKDDLNVSDAELERRLAWFKSFLPKAAITAASPPEPYTYEPHTLTLGEILSPIREFSDPRLASEEPDDMGKELIEAWGDAEVGGEVPENSEHWMQEAIVTYERLERNRNAYAVHAASKWEGIPCGKRQLPVRKGTRVTISSSVLALRDTQDTYDAMFNLYQKGSIPIDVILDLLNIDPVTAAEGLKRDLFTLNDASMNETLRSVYSKVGDQLVDGSDVTEKVAKSLGLKYAKPTEDAGRF